MSHVYMDCMMAEQTTCSLKWLQPVALNDYSMQRALNIDLYVDSDDKAIKVT